MWQIFVNIHASKQMANMETFRNWNTTTSRAWQADAITSAENTLCRMFFIVTVTLLWGKFLLAMEIFSSTFFKCIMTELDICIMYLQNIQQNEQKNKKMSCPHVHIRALRPISTLHPRNTVPFHVWQVSRLSLDRRTPLVPENASSHVSRS